MKKWINKLINKSFRFIFNIISHMVSKNDKLIVFESFHGKQFSDNPRSIYEYLKKYHPEYKLYWSADRRYINVFENKNIKYVRRLSIRWMYLMSKSKFWIVNVRMPLWIKKPEGTIYIQTWHGTPLKKLGVDIEQVLMPGTNTEKYKKNFVFEASKWDYLVSPNEYSSDIFSQAFQYNKDIIESGYPRNDYLINQNNEEEIEVLKRKIGLPLDRKIILYAPTWRDNQFYSKGRYKFNLKLDLKKLKEEIEEDYIILLRMHYLISENLDLGGFENFVYDLSNHEDIRELYLISDMMITDYSSVFFDYANLQRPILFFVYDIEEYRDNLRGFYFDFENKAPGPLLKNTGQILSEIKKIDKLGFIPNKKEKDFYNQFCYLEDGRASERVVNKVLKN